MGNSIQAFKTLKSKKVGMLIVLQVCFLNLLIFTYEQ